MFQAPAIAWKDVVKFHPSKIQMADWASGVNIPNLGDDISLSGSPYFSVHIVTSVASPDIQETISAAGRFSALSTTVNYVNKPKGRMPSTPNSIPGP